MERRVKRTELGDNNRLVTELAQVRQEGQALDAQISELIKLEAALRKEAALARLELSSNDAQGSA